MILLDTDHISILQHAESAAAQALDERLGLDRPGPRSPATYSITGSHPQSRLPPAFLFPRLIPYTRHCLPSSFSFQP